jgi:kumamolisin
VTRRVRKTLLSFAALLSIAAVAAPAQSVNTRHVRDAVRSGSAQSVGRMDANQTLQLDLVLPLRAPRQFTARFGPTQDQYDTVLRFAGNYGFQVVGGSRDGMDVQVKATVAAIETAFHLSMRLYRHPTENRIFYAPDAEPRLDLPFNLWHISGLDNYSLPHPLYSKKSDYAAAHGIEPDAVVKHATTGSGPSASFLGSDMRAAYYGSGPLTGAGQNLGLLEYYGTDLADLTTYFKNTGQTNNVPVTVLSTDGTSTSCTHSKRKGCDDTEQTLDMTQAIGMAPGLASLVMYVGSTDTAIIGAMTTHSPLPTTIGCSWGWTPADPTTLDPYFEKMAAQGQNFFVASGDNSTWSSSGRAEAWPADNAYIVSVGGTDLVTSGAAGPWASETAWVDSGGGISPDNIAIPDWQKLAGVITSTNKGSTTLRNGPDVSANANFTFYVCANQTTCIANEFGGTSFAAPMWAAYTALVNQQRAANSDPTIGFLNPTIYAQNVTSSYASDFHDITSGTSGSHSAVAGFDLVTGWGSPNTGLLAALAGSTNATPGFTLSASPTSVSVATGATSSAVTITSAVSGGFSSAIGLTASGLPTGVTAGFSPASIAGAGSSSLTFTVGASVTPGTYAITVTGTSGSTTSSTTVSLTVTGVPAAYSIGVAPTSISVTRSSSGKVTVTSTVTGGFNSAIALSAAGQGNGITISFSPASITGAGTSTMTITASSKATTGTKTITISGKSGTTTHTATVSLTIVR